MEQNSNPGMVPSIERVTHAVGLWMEAALKDLGITQAEAHILGRLTSVGRCSINDLHHAFGHRRSTLTSILDRLEERGMVRRTPHPTSRRSVMVELTGHGEIAARRVTALLAGLDTFVAGRATPEDLKGFHAVLGAIEEGVRDRR